MALTDLDFADNISLFSDTVEEDQELLAHVETVCSNMGLALNAKKTEVITYNARHHTPPTATEGRDFSTWARG